MTVRFGVALPTYPAGMTVEGVVEVAQAAERLGFVSAWTTDHIVLPIDEAGPYGSILEPLMTLAYVAALTKTLTLGVSILVVPQRNGIVVGKQLTTLDRLSRGRLIVGVGAGWNEAEFAMLDAGDRFHRRGAYLDETLRLWQHLWESPATPFEGQFYQLPPVAFGPGPTQSGGPPIWVGGDATAALHRAGRFGAAWHPVAPTVEEVRTGMDTIRQAAAAAGRPRPILAPRFPMEMGQPAAGQITASNLAVMRGEPEQIVESLKPYEAVGAEEIVCLFGASNPAGVLAQMEQFAGSVMPAFT